MTCSRQDTQQLRCVSWLVQVVSYPSFRAAPDSSGAAFFRPCAAPRCVAIVSRSPSQQQTIFTMTFPKHIFLEPSLLPMLQLCQAEERPELREAAFMVFAYDLVDWFLRANSLQSVRLTSVARATVYPNGQDVRMRHHFKVVVDAAKADLPPTFPDNPEHYAINRLPWQTMGNGTCVIARANPWLQKAMATPEDDVLEFRTALFALASEVDAAFLTPTLTQDVGLLTASLE